jgi:hypothetical protein
MLFMEPGPGHPITTLSFCLGFRRRVRSRSARGRWCRGPGRVRHALPAQAGREREARNAGAVEALLNQCEEALKANDAAKASIALEAARRRSAEDGADEHAGRLGRLDADLALLRDLGAVE